MFLFVQDRNMASKQDPTLPTTEKLLGEDTDVQNKLALWWQDIRSLHSGSRSKICGLGSLARAICEALNARNIFRVREGKILPSRVEAYLHLYLARKMMDDGFSRMDVWVSGSWQVWTRSMFDGLELSISSVQDRVRDLTLRRNLHNREAYYLAALTWMRRNPAEVPKVVAMVASVWRRTETEVFNDLEELASAVTMI